MRLDGWKALVNPNAQEWVEWKKRKHTSIRGLRLDRLSNDPEGTVHSVSQTATSLATCQYQQVKEEASVPVDGADAGHTFPVAHLLQQQSVSDLPGEHGGVAAFQMQDRLHNGRCGYFGFRAPDHSWSDASCLIVPDLTISTILY